MAARDGGSGALLAQQKARAPRHPFRPLLRSFGEHLSDGAVGGARRGSEGALFAVWPARCLLFEINV
jgi:hypothetical protein